MRALCFDGQTARVIDRPEPDLADGSALIRVSRAGICNTDLEIVRGYMGFRGVLGHEFVGRVEDGPAEWLGRRVVGEINFACGHCEECARGLGRHCPTRRVMGILDADGAFAERVAVPVANLHAVPDSVPDDAAVFVEPLAAAFEILEQVAIYPSDRCVVLGDGKLGLLTAQVMMAATPQVKLVGHHPEKLALAAARGIETRLARDFQPHEERADVVVEATGSAVGFEMALAATRPRGTLVLKSTVADRPALDLAPLVIHEIQVVGSRCGRFEPAVRALVEGTVDVVGLIADRLPLARADEALRRADEPGTLKILLDCD